MGRLSEWLLEAIGKQGCYSEAELYDEIRRQGKDLPQRSNPPADSPSLNEELELFSVLHSMQDKFVLRLAKGEDVYWIVYLKHSKPFLLRNVSEAWRSHNSSELFRDYKNGYEYLNDILTEYVAWRLSDLSSLQRFESEKEIPEREEIAQPQKASIWRKKVSESFTLHWAAQLCEIKTNDRFVVHRMSAFHTQEMTSSSGSVPKIII